MGAHLGVSADEKRLKTVRGFQCKNDIFSCVVEKRVQSVFFAMLMRFLHSPIVIAKPYKFLRSSQRGVFLAKERFRTLSENRKIHILFNLIDVNDRVVVQRRMTPLGMVLHTKPLDELMLIQKYFSFVTCMIRYGVFEYTFNYFENYGVCSEGNVKLIDVGEFSFDKSDLIGKVNAGKVCLPGSMRFKFGSSLKYYIKLQNAIYNMEFIEANWGALLVYG